MLQSKSYIRNSVDLSSFDQLRKAVIARGSEKVIIKLNKHIYIHKYSISRRVHVSWNWNQQVIPNISSQKFIIFFPVCRSLYQKICASGTNIFKSSECSSVKWMHEWLYFAVHVKTCNFWSDKPLKLSLINLIWHS